MLSPNRLLSFVLIPIVIAVALGVFFFFRWKNGEKTHIENAGVESEEEIKLENKDNMAVDSGGDNTNSDVGENAVEDLKKEPTQNADNREEKTVVEEKKNDEKKEKTLEIKNNLVSFGFEKGRGGKSVDTIIIHSSYNPLDADKFDTEKIIAIYKSYGVAAHYIVARNGEILRLVSESDTAFHAGAGTMPDGRDGINAFSIGIEVVGSQEEGPTKEQYSALNDLIADIKSRHKISFALGHKDIAPGRKTDPWEFDWGKIDE